MESRLWFLFLIPFVLSKAPHILFIVGDDYGWNDIGYHGSEISTPNLDKLASEGVILEQFYAHSICAPSRATIMTGRYPYHLGFQHDNPPKYGGSPAGLPLDEITLPQNLKKYGYNTSAVGKWHLGYFEESYLPINRGFDRYFGFYEGSFDYYTHGNPNGEPGLLDLHNQTQEYNLCAPQWDLHYSTRLFANAAQQAIKAHLAHTPTDTPSFLYVAFHSVHQPLEVPAAYEEPYNSINDTKRRKYCGMVAIMDEAIGNITQEYINLGIWNDTLLVFLADNGGWVTHGGNNFPLRGGKTTMYEGGLRVNAFMRSNLISKPGRKTMALLHEADLFPTLLNLASGGTYIPPVDKPLDGYNVWDTIAQDAPSPRTEILHNIDPLSYSPDLNTSCSVIRVGDWKLIDGYHCNPETDCFWYAPPSMYNGYHNVIPPFMLPSLNLELFNIAQDPNEYTNLAEVYPDKVQELRDRIAYYQQTMVNPLWPPYCCDAEPDQWQAAATANDGCVVSWH